MLKGFLFSTFLQTLVISYLFDTIHSQWGEVISHCGVNLHLSWGAWVAQSLSVCLRLRAWCTPGVLGSSPTSGSSARSLLLPLPLPLLVFPLLLAVSISLKVINKIFKKNLHFSDDYRCQTYFHVSVGHMYVFLGKTSTQVLCPFFNQIVFRCLSCMNSLHILDFF